MFSICFCVRSLCSFWRIMNWRQPTRSLKTKTVMDARIIMITIGKIQGGRATIEANVALGFTITPMIRPIGLSLPAGAGVGKAGGVVVSDMHFLLRLGTEGSFATTHAGEKDFSWRNSIGARRSVSHF